MNRHDLITRTLMLESVAVEAKARAQKLRDLLAADARAEFEEQGTAPTWRIQDVGTVTLPVSSERVVVSDEAALTRFAKERFPDEVEVLERIRPAFLPVLVGLMDHDSDRVFDGEGTVVPGLTVRPGGAPQSLSFRPSRDAQAVARAAAEKLVGDVEEALGGPLILAENPDA